MIPRVLHIKNFLSYGPEIQTIDFAHYNLICLSGKNGHGKSALLDAITWSIWGQARKVTGSAKADAGLVHLGQKHMVVTLEFEVNNQIYKVRREFVQTASKPFAALDFGIIQPDGTITALTDKTIKATQQKIEKVIGITYDAFINSAFLRQGQSNEFSKKSPKERKEILADILQLQQFEDKKNIALTHARKLQTEYKTLLALQDRITAELQPLHTLDKEHEQLIQSMHDFKSQKERYLSHKTEYEKQKDSYNQQKVAYELAKKQSVELKEQIIQKQIQLKELQHALNTFPKTDSIPVQDLEKQRTLLQQKSLEIQTKQKQKSDLKDQLTSLKEQRNVFVSQHEKIHDQKLLTLHIELSKQEQVFQTILEQLKKETISQEEEISQTELEKNITLYADHEAFKTLESVKIEQQTLHNYEHELRTRASHALYIHESIKTIQQQYDTLDQAGAECPTCFDILTPDKKIAAQQSLKQSLSEKKQQLEQSIVEESLLLQKKDEQLIIYEKAQKIYSLYVEKSKLLEHLEQKNKAYDTLLNQQKSIAHTIQELQKNIQLQHDTKNNIIEHPEYNMMQASITKIEAEISLFQNIEQEHTEIQKHIELVHIQLQQTLNYAEQLEKKNLIQQQIVSLSTLLQKEIDAHTELEQKLPSLNIHPDTIQELTRIERNLQEQYAALEQQHGLIFSTKGSLEHKKRKKLELESEQDHIQREITRLKHEIIDYTEIAKALGKDGIQALLIEQAIPEIEDAANEILARLTNNQTQIFIESLKDLKKGGNKETLDIKISDFLGLRNYELFSGGEAFRIDFALRIGISKLLAKRAGTTLQTIFIDEGFGSQDEEGLGLIMDNLYKIQSDFAKIIIVSHLPEMKEQFPVQFIVEKKRTGSCISIIEQG